MEFKDFLLETKFVKILKALRGDVPHIKQMGILTAQNPLGVEGTPQENNFRNRELVTRLRRMNFRGWPVDPKEIMGKFGNTEDSFFVPHISREDLVALGANFGQRSVIWGTKQTGEEGSFVRFEYIDTPADKEPVDPTSYRTSQIRDVILSGSEVSSRDDNFSAKPYPRSPIKQAGANIRKLAVPFFDDKYDKAKKDAGGRGIKGVTEDFSFVASDLPVNPEVIRLVEEINRQGKAIYTEGKVGRWYWESRGLLETYLQKLREII